MSVKDKVCVVTGGSRGIGLEICRRLVADGAKVALIGTREETAQNAVKELGAAADQVKGYALNVADGTAVGEVFTQILSDFGQVDVLVNNAGITRNTLIMRIK